MVALRGNRGPGCATCSTSQIDVVLYRGSDRVSVCLYCTGVILVEACGHSSPPPFFAGGPGCDWDCVLSLHMVGYPEEYITFLRLVVVASTRLPLVSVGVGLIVYAIDAEPPFHETPMIGCCLVN